MDNTKRELAEKMYDRLCDILDEANWSYDENREELTIMVNVKGDDLDMSFIIVVDEERQNVRLLSVLPFEFKKEKLLDISIAVNVINDALVNGSFDIDIERGAILFRMTNSFIDSSLSKRVFEYMVHGACHMVDMYNDKLLLISSGMLTIEKFLESFAN